MTSTTTIAPTIIPASSPALNLDGVADEEVARVVLDALSHGIAVAGPVHVAPDTLTAAQSNMMLCCWMRLVLVGHKTTASEPMVMPHARHCHTVNIVSVIYCETDAEVPQFL